MAESSKALMQVNIVAADHPVWHGTAKSVTIPASEGEMGILADHEPVLTVIKGGTVSVVDPAGERHALHSGSAQQHLLPSRSSQHLHH